jgi:hypothetical protein
VEMLVSLLAGWLLGVGTSWYFARKSGRELQEEARRLANLSELILHALENAGLAEVRRDQHFGRWGHKWTSGGRGYSACPSKRAVSVRQWKEVSAVPW